MSHRIDAYEFTKEGFEALKSEVKVTQELVRELLNLLSPDQRAAIAEKQNSRHLSQAEFEEFAKKRGKAPLGAQERAIRIALLPTSDESKS